MLAAETALSAGVLYYGLSGLRRRPTLGEEYSDLMQVTGSSRVTAGQGVRLMLFNTLLPYLASRLLKKIRNRLSRSEPGSTLELLVGQLEALLKFWQRSHLAVFYFTGEFFEPSKRFARIRSSTAPQSRMIVSRADMCTHARSRLNLRHILCSGCCSQYS